MFILFISHLIARPFRNMFAEMVLVYCIIVLDSSRGFSFVCSNTRNAKLSFLHVLKKCLQWYEGTTIHNQNMFFPLQVILGLTSLMRISLMNLLNCHVRLVDFRMSVAPHRKVSCLTTVSTSPSQENYLKAI